MGMGVTFTGALIMVILAYIAQSPGFAARIGLGGTRIAYQVKTYTGYALAFMILCLGFFLAGVPLDPSLVKTAVPTATVTAVANANTGTATIEPTTNTLEPSPTTDSNATLTPASGAFGGPPPGLADETTAEAITGTVAVETAIPEFTATPANSATPVTSTPTPTASSTPTATPSPTTTPTPIDGETAVLNLGGNVIWLQRAPGRQNMVVLQDKEIVILLGGRANRAGTFWREVATGNGTVGWVQEQYLQFPDE